MGLERFFFRFDGIEIQRHALRLRVSMIREEEDSRVLRSIWGRWRLSGKVHSHQAAKLGPTLD